MKISISENGPSLNIVNIETRAIISLANNIKEITRHENKLAISGKVNSFEFKSEFNKINISQIGSQGPRGPSGSTTAYTSPVFSYIAGVLSRIDYADGSYKVFTYMAGLLAQLDFHIFGQSSVQRKTFIYSDGILISTPETIV
jgi:hypothetical protein